MTDLTRQPDHPQGGAFRDRAVADPFDRDTIEVSEVLAVFRHHAWAILLFMALGAGAAWVVPEFREPAYRALASIRVVDPALRLSEQLTAFDGRGTGPDPILAVVELARSRGVLGAIAHREGLRLHPLDTQSRGVHLRNLQAGGPATTDTVRLSFEAGMVTGNSSGTRESASAPVGGVLTLSDIRFEVAEATPGVSRAAFLMVEEEQAIRGLERRLSVRHRPHTDILTVEYVAPDPILAQRVANRAVQVVIERSAEEAIRLSQRRRVLVEGQLMRADSSRQVAQEALSEFRRRTRAFNSGQLAAARQTRLVDVEIRWEALRTERDLLLAMLEGLEGAAGTEAEARLPGFGASPELASNPAIAPLLQQLVALEAERDALVEGPPRAEPLDPELIRLNERIALVRARLETAARSLLAGLEARLQSMEELRSETVLGLTGSPEADAEEARLLHRLSLAELTVEQLHREYQLARLAEAVDQGQVEVVDEAPLPLGPEGSTLPVLLSLGVMLGFMVGTGSAFVRESLNTSIRRRGEIESELEAPTLGTIPDLSPVSGGIPKRMARLRRSAAAAVEGGPGTPVPELATLDRMRTAEAEAFRTLRTNLLLAEGRAPVRLVVVTSPRPSDGKTTVAANLAVACAQHGLRALLVDGDLRRPRLGTILDVPQSPGLAELARGSARGSEVTHPLDAVPGLHVIPAGTVLDAPLELVGGTRLPEILSAFRVRYDLVIVDTPPLSAGTDAAILGSLADGVLMVVRAGVTQRAAVRLARRQLHLAGATLLGAVLNDPTGRWAGAP